MQHAAHHQGSGCGHEAACNRSGLLELASCTRRPNQPYTSAIAAALRQTPVRAGQPIIHALGMQLPEREVGVSTISLVIQDGPEREWNWTTVDTIPLVEPAR